MNPNEAKETAKGFLRDYLNSKGIDASRNFTCLNPSHNDKHPSMMFDANRNKCHCFACNADYDIFDLIKIETGLDGSELFNYTYKLLNIHVEYNSLNKEDSHVKYNFSNNQNNNSERQDLSSFFDECHSAVNKTSYWKTRGLSKETVDKFNLGFWEEKQRFVIPTGKYSYNARAINEVDKKNRYLKPKGSFELFNLSVIKNCKDPVFIVEGEFDALSIEEAGGSAVAFGSSGNSGFYEFIKNNPPELPLIISLDNDEAGIKAAEKLKEGLEKINIDYVQIDVAGEYKDANEALVRDRELFVQNIQNAKNNVLEIIKKKKEEEAEKYYKTSAAFEIQDFITGIERRYNRDCVSTGFKNLDQVLDGGFYPGLYIIGAISSLGKTTFALQIADLAAQNGQDVLVFSLEMAKQELIAKSLSRISMEKCKGNDEALKNASSTRNILNGKALKNEKSISLLNECLAQYTMYAGRIFYHIGIGDIGVEKIKTVIEKHIKVTGKKPLVVIDYLQIIAPFDIRATDKQNTDKAVVELKRASRDFDIPVFAISSFNRENYTNPVNIASFKESGAIEYTSDVLMALQYKGMDYVRKEDGKFEDEKSRSARILELRQNMEKQAETLGKSQDIQLKILKNRNGRKGNVDFQFYPMFNYFEEAKSSVEQKGQWVLRKDKK